MVSKILILFILAHALCYLSIEALMQINLRGSRLTPVFTPVYKNGTINTSAISNYANFMSMNNFTALWLFGIAGEPFSFNLVERKTILSAWVNINRVKRYGFLIFIGTGFLTVSDSCDLASYSERIGVNGIVYNAIAEAGAMTPEQAVSDLSNVAQCAPKTPFFYFSDPHFIFCDRNPNVGEVFRQAVLEIPNLAGFIGPTELCLQVRAYNPGCNALIINTFYYGVSPANLNGFDAHSTSLANIFPDYINEIDNAQTPKVSMAAQDRFNCIVTTLCNLRKDSPQTATVSN